MSFRYRKDSFADDDQKPYLLILAPAAKTGEITVPADGATGNQVITGVGFKPDVVFFIASQNEATGGTSGRMTIGCATSPDADQQWSGSARLSWLSNPPIRVKSWRPGYCITCSDTSPVDNSPDEALRASLVSFDADGFTLNYDIVGPWRGHNMTRYAYLAMQGDFRAGITTVGHDITGVPFQPKGVFLFSTRSMPTDGVQGNQGWQMSMGFASDDGQASTSGAAVDQSEMYSGGIFSSGYWDEESCMNIIRPANGVGAPPGGGPASDPLYHRVAWYARAVYNSMTPDGVSLFWSTSPNEAYPPGTPPTVFAKDYDVGYLCCGGDGVTQDAEGGNFHQPPNSFDPTEIYRDVQSRFCPNATLIGARGIVAPGREHYLYGGACYLGIGAANEPYGWLDRFTSHPPEEFWAGILEGGGGYGTGGGLSYSESGYGTYQQAKSADHGEEGNISDDSGGGQNGINIVECIPNVPLIVGTNWRVSADRRAQGIGRLHIEE